MIKISSYILYNLSNLVFILLIPNSFSKLFFLNYSIASGIFTFIVFYHFSKKTIFSENFLIGIITTGIIISQILNSNIFTIWLFTMLIIYSDYFFSQRENYITNFILKLLLFITSFFLYQNFLDPLIVLKIKILIIYFTFVWYYIFLTKYKFTPLNVKSPLLYNFWTCLIYFSSLFILTILVPNNFIKIIYVSFQIIIGIQLKLFDLKIRDIKVKYFNLEIIFALLSFLYIIGLSIYSKIIYLIIFYLAIFFCLNFLKSKYINISKNS